MYRGPLLPTDPPTVKPVCSPCCCVEMAFPDLLPLELLAAAPPGRSEREPARGTIIGSRDLEDCWSSGTGSFSCASGIRVLWNIALARAYMHTD